MKKNVRWHPGACSAIELELRENKDDLEFHREYNLSKEPLRIDLLVVEKREGVMISNEIGRIFKKYNIIEYKNPADGFSIDDYFKVMSYVLLYKSSGKFVNEIPIDELTATIVRDVYPRKLIKDLKSIGMEIKTTIPGIYEVKGFLMIPTQIIVTSKLREGHTVLHAMSKKMNEQQVRNILSEAEKMELPDDRTNMNAVMYVSMQANSNIYEKVRRNEAMYAYPALIEFYGGLYKEKIEEEIKEEIKEKVREGKAEEKVETLVESIFNLMESAKWDAMQAMSALRIPESEQPMYLERVEAMRGKEA
jgi:hypothetical protein